MVCQMLGIEVGQKYHLGIIVIKQYLNPWEPMRLFGESRWNGKNRVLVGTHVLIDRGKERGPAELTEELQGQENQESVTKDEGAENFRKRTNQVRW